ncbi:MAG: ATP-dependent DNA helicase RecQ [bacterium]
MENDEQIELGEGLLKYFGFSAFREGQQDIAQSVMDGLHALAVMPTGSGKSLCYQLPACLLDGITLVVSPLIALMKDQVDGAVARGIPAACINSSMSWHEQTATLQDMVEGRLKLVYVAPERFRNAAFMEAIAQTKVALLAVDEAHCISQWGHDFRPDYLEIGEFRRQLGSPVTLALTATATPEVQADILAQLDIKDARVIVSGFERPNLFFEVRHVGSEEEKFGHLDAVLQHFSGQSVVIYCATRKQVELVRARMENAGHLVSTYHGGLGDARRHEVQEAFMAGDVPVLVATNAFGMGVDKSDVRAIVHFNVPGSVEAYYQEAGRAGRDGDPAHCLLLFHANDRSVHEFFIDLSYPTPDVVMAVWTELKRYGLGTHAVGADMLAQYINRSSKQTNVSSGAVEAALRLLKSVGHVDFGVRDGFPWTSVMDLSRTRDLRVDWDQISLRRDIATRQLNDVVRFCCMSDCRQLQLLRHFNSRSTFGSRCGHCDQCKGPAEMESRAREIHHVPDDAATIVRKVLSGVARTQSRASMQIVAAMLRGSRSKLVNDRNLHELSTYGVLSYLQPAEILELFDLCERHHLIVKSGRGRLGVTEEGTAVMKGEETIPEGMLVRMERRWREESAA